MAVAAGVGVAGGGPTVTANIYSDLYSDELDHVATNLDRQLHDSIANKANGQEPDKTDHP